MLIIKAFNNATLNINNVIKKVIIANKNDICILLLKSFVMLR